MASASESGTTNCPGCNRTVPDKGKCYICGTLLHPAGAAPANTTVRAGAGNSAASVPSASSPSTTPATQSRAPQAAGAPAVALNPAPPGQSKPLPTAGATSHVTPPVAKPASTINPGGKVLSQHYVAREKAYLVTVGGRILNMPACCACCLNDAETTFKVTATHATQQVMGMDRGTITNISFDFPACNDCRQHMQGNSMSALLAFVVTGIACIGVLYALGFNFFLDAANGHSLRLISLVALGGLFVAACYSVVWLKQWFDRFRPEPGAGHAGRGQPIEANFAGFKKGENDDDYPDAPITFTFKNREFGERFIAANRG
jgi:hypothetical protein